jgi:hypothetical protein
MAMCFCLGVNKECFWLLLKGTIILFVEQGPKVVRRSTSFGVSSVVLVLGSVDLKLN